MTIQKFTTSLINCRLCKHVFKKWGRLATIVWQKIKILHFLFKYRWNSIEMYTLVQLQSTLARYLRCENGKQLVRGTFCNLNNWCACNDRVWNWLILFVWRRMHYLLKRRIKYLSPRIYPHSTNGMHKLSHFQLAPDWMIAHLIVFSLPFFSLVYFSLKLQEDALTLTLSGALLQTKINLFRESNPFATFWTNTRTSLECTAVLMHK